MSLDLGPAKYVLNSRLIESRKTYPCERGAARGADERKDEPPARPPDLAASAGPVPADARMKLAAMAAAAIPAAQ